MRYGIFGCTADPFTLAHYEIVNNVLKDGIVDKVIVIPTVVSYYRKDKDVMFDYAQRRTIVEHWFSGRADVILDFYEYGIAEDAVNDRRYWHTLNDVISRYGKDNEFFTIVGGDSWNNLEKWFNFKLLGELTKFVVVKRDEDKLLDYSDKHSEYRCQPVAVIETNGLSNASATNVRNMLNAICNDITIKLETYLELLESLKHK